MLEERQIRIKKELFRINTDGKIFVIINDDVIHAVPKQLAGIASLIKETS